MPHNVTLITTIVAALGAALALGFLAARLKLPVLIGYLAAGIIIGPFTPGFVADVDLSSQLAEIGVMLLMFGVGLHFSIDELLAVRKIAIPGAIVQIAVATSLGIAVTNLWGWNFAAGLVFGLSLSVASTVVLLRALESRGVLETVNGHIAVGWLVVEDLVTVLVLVLLPPLSLWLGGSGGDQVGGQELVDHSRVDLRQSCAFCRLHGDRRATYCPLDHLAYRAHRTARTFYVVRHCRRGWDRLRRRSALRSLVCPRRVLRGNGHAGVAVESPGCGGVAAFQGCLLRAVFRFGRHALRSRRCWFANRITSWRLWRSSLSANPLPLFVLVLLFRYPLNTALTVSAGLAQIGEFSFILGQLGLSLGILPEEARSLILAGGIISIAVNPLVFRAIEPLQAWIRAKSKRAQLFERPDDPLATLPMTIDLKRLTGHVVLVGYGRVGRRIGDELSGAWYLVRAR